MLIKTVKTAIFRQSEDLTSFILHHVKKLADGDILVITSKIVALAEGRVVEIVDKQKAITDEAEKLVATPWGRIALIDGVWCLGAGVDESNADNHIILLPKHPMQTAEKLCRDLKKFFKIKNLGVLITDTRSVPLRQGTVGRVLGYAGFAPLKSYVGQKDLFGRKTRRTVTNVADALASAAVVMMGEGNEQTPLAVIKGAPVKFVIKNPLPKNLQNLSMPAETDIYAAIFKTGKKAQN